MPAVLDDYIVEIEETDPLRVVLVIRMLRLIVMGRHWTKLVRSRPRRWSFECGVPMHLPRRAAAAPSPRSFLVTEVTQLRPPERRPVR
jgi:hypothetical protein